MGKEMKGEHFKFSSNFAIWEIYSEWLRRWDSKAYIDLIGKVVGAGVRRTLYRYPRPRAACAVQAIPATPSNLHADPVLAHRAAEVLFLSAKEMKLPARS